MSYIYISLYALVDVYVHIFIWIYIYIYTYTYTYTYNTYIHTDRQTDIHPCIHTYIQTDRQTYIHTFMHTCTRVCIQNIISNHHVLQGFVYEICMHVFPLKMALRLYVYHDVSCAALHICYCILYILAVGSS